MNRAEKILADKIDNGGDKTIKMHHFKPVEKQLLEAMKQIAWEAWKEALSGFQPHTECIDKPSFLKWWEEQV